MQMKMSKEIKVNDLNNAALCKMSLEVVFKEGLDCNTRKRKRRVIFLFVAIFVAVIVVR